LLAAMHRPGSFLFVSKQARRCFPITLLGELAVAAGSTTTAIDRGGLGLIVTVSQHMLRVRGDPDVGQARATPGPLPPTTGQSTKPAHTQKDSIRYRLALARMVKSIAAVSLPWSLPTNNQFFRARGHCGGWCSNRSGRETRRRSSPDR
jgi:hypothetical protein